jgi:transposase
MDTERSTSTAEPTPLPDNLSVCHAMIRELLDSLKKTRHDYESVQQRLDLLLRKLYGPKAERFDPNQPWLLPEMAPDAAAADAVESPKEESPSDDAAPQRKGHGRKPLPKDLPRRRIEHTLAETERLCPCCNKVCTKFGEDISEQLDYQPASLFVWQHVRFKYACPGCHDHITVGHAPIAVINKGLPGPGLLAQIAASKYADHLPLHRLERILGRHGIELSRSTMCDWMAHVAALLQPVVDLMATLVRQSKLIHTDATKMPFLDSKTPGRTLSGQMWVYVGDRDHRIRSVKTRLVWRLFRPLTRSVIRRAIKKWFAGAASSGREARREAGPRRDWVQRPGAAGCLASTRTRRCGGDDNSM